MQAQYPTIHTLAGEAYGQFERKARENGDNYVSLKDSAPEWLRELVHDAHGDFLPDDWRYDTIRDALGAIADNEPDDLDDYAGEFADGAVDTYTGQLVAWLASHSSRVGYCDDAVSEGLVPEDAELIGRIRIGQYMEAQEVFASVAESLRTRLAEVQS